MPSQKRAGRAKTATRSAKRVNDESDDDYIQASQSKRPRNESSSKVSCIKQAGAMSAVIKSNPSAKNDKKAAKHKSMPDLPMELIYEIASYLPPGDLASLCDTSPSMWHAFCNSSPLALARWKQGREREGVFEIPSGINEYHWAKLFLGTRCMECGIDKVNNSAAIDFFIRRRLCTTCKKSKYVDHYGLGQNEFEAAALCPFTRLKWDGTNNGCNKFYWMDDVVAQREKLKGLDADIECGKEGAVDRFEKYFKTRQAQVKVIIDDAPRLAQLHKDYLRKLKEKSNDQFMPRYEQIKSRFVELGYLVNDFPPNFKMHKLVRQKAKLTDRAWKNVREALEPEMQAARSAREAKEWLRLKVARRQIVDQVYAQYKFDHIPPPEWKYLPQVHHICRIPAFLALVEADHNRTVTAADFLSCLEDLNSALSSAYEETKTRLRKRVVAAKDPFFTPDIQKATTFKDLELAVLVFRCTSCKRGVFGWDDVRSHCCGEADEMTGLDVLHHEGTDELRDGMGTKGGSEFPKKFEYWLQGSMAARLVVKSLGLDPTTTTTAEMDMDPDLRMECWCSGAGGKRPCAHRWRLLAWHLTREYHEKDGHTKPLKGKLPDQYLREILDKELETWSRKSIYACTHCPRYLKVGEQVMYRQIEEHLFVEHDIDNTHSKLNVDYVALPNDNETYRHFYEGTCYSYQTGK